MLYFKYRNVIGGGFTDNKVIGNNIKEQRKRQRYTQSQLADMIGKTESTIRKYENGSIQVPNNVLQRIAQVLKVSPVDLTGWASYDEQHKDSIKEISEFGAFIFYLESISYKVNINPESAETFSALLTKNGISTTYTDAEFKEFQKTIQESIDYQVWRKNNK